MCKEFTPLDDRLQHSSRYTEENNKPIKYRKLRRNDFIIMANVEKSRERERERDDDEDNHAAAA